MQEKIRSLINFAIRAKKYTIGENVVFSKKGKVKLALLASNASDNTKKRYKDKNE